MNRRLDPNERDDAAWTRLLSEAAQPDARDELAPAIAICAVRRERDARYHQRSSLLRLVAGLAAATVVAVSLSVHAPATNYPTEGFDAYREASQAW